MRVYERAAISVTQKLTILDCPSCGVVHAITVELQDRAYADGRSLYCPVGHRYSWGETDADRLKRKLDAAERDADRLRAYNDQILAENAEQAKTIRRQERERKAAERRAHAGVCPWCYRTFVQMARHMKAKHPDKAST